MTSKTVVLVMCVVCFVFWPFGGQYAEEPEDTKANGYEIPWWAMTGGGGASSGGSYEMMATIGQPGIGESAGGTYILAAGFLASESTPIVAEIFSDGFETGNASRWSSTFGL